MKSFLEGTARHWFRIKKPSSWDDFKKKFFKAYRLKNFLFKDGTRRVGVGIVHFQFLNAVFVFRDPQIHPPNFKTGLFIDFYQVQLFVDIRPEKPVVLAIMFNFGKKQV